MTARRDHMILRSKFGPAGCECPAFLAILTDELAMERER